MSQQKANLPTTGAGLEEEMTDQENTDIQHPRSCRTPVFKREGLNVETIWGGSSSHRLPVI